MKSWLEKNTIEMDSTHNEGKSVIADRFIRTLKNKICKYMTSISKNVYTDKLYDVVNEYNITHHRAIKMKLLMQNQAHILTLVKKLMMKILNLKLVILLEYRNKKTFLQNAMFQISLKKFFLLQNVKTMCRGHMLLVILKVKNLLECFMKKNCEKQIKKGLELKK